MEQNKDCFQNTPVLLSYKRAGDCLQDELIEKKPSEDLITGEPLAGKDEKRDITNYENTIGLSCQKLTNSGEEAQEVKPPKDAMHAIFLIFVLQGIGGQLAWNMFITAKDYYEKYKLAEDNTPPSERYNYAMHFLNNVNIASLFPSLLIHWINVFVPIRGDNLRSRVFWSLATEVVVFLITISLAIINTSRVPGLFLILTLASIVVVNTASGLQFNSICGLGALLPANYAAAAIMGANISGIVPAIFQLSVLYAGNDYVKSATYYFSAGLIVLLACFGTFYALPLFKFYRYHMAMKPKHGTQNSGIVPPYWTIFKEASVQLINIYFTFFVTISLYPSVLSEIPSVDEQFFISKKYYKIIACYMTFVIASTLGCILSNYCNWPGQKYLFILVAARILYIPFFLFCNYLPRERTLPVFLKSNWIFLIGNMSMGISAGFIMSHVMKYTPGMVEPKYASTAGMIASSVAITGAISGSFFSLIYPSLVSGL